MLKKWLKSLSYAKIVATGYLLIILVGALLLMLPAASRVGTPTDFFSALFTSTSATCVTGLVVVDTFTHWSLFGQIVILVLIQIGGLGFMTVVTMFFLLLNKRIGLRTRGILRESVNSMYVGGIIKLLRRILLGTLLVEGIAAVI